MATYFDLAVVVTSLRLETNFKDSNLSDWISESVSRYS